MKLAERLKDRAGILKIDLGWAHELNKRQARKQIRGAREGL